MKSKLLKTLEALREKITQETERLFQTEKFRSGDIPKGFFERVIAVSDIHSDFELLLNQLQHTSKVIGVDEGGRVHWKGGNKVAIVIVGDIVDRHRETGVSDQGEFLGEEESMLTLLNLVDIIARPYKSRVFKILGNHEILNTLGKFQSVSKLGFCSFDRKSCSPTGRLRAFKKGGSMYRALSNSFGMLRIDNLIFVHGGVTPELVSNVMSHVRKKEGRNFHFNFIQLVNHLVQQMFLTDPSEWKSKFDPWFYLLFLDEKGILWNREFSQDTSTPSCKRIKDTFLEMGYNHPDMMFLYGHSHQSFRCFYKIRKGVSCDEAGYTYKKIVYEDQDVRVFGGPLERQNGLHGITFFCPTTNDSSAKPQLCLLDSSQSRSFDLKQNALGNTQQDHEWLKKLEEARNPSCFQAVYHENAVSYTILQSKKSLSRD